jgi:hypothetical protein
MGSAVSDKPRIAHFASSNATIHNSPPLVTSNKARAKHGLTTVEGRFDALRPQRLAAPVIVYVEQFSAHPLERDASDLYGPPDGYVDAGGNFHKERQATSDKPAYEVKLDPKDGLYALPYMALQADGRPWDDDSAEPGAPAPRARQPFHPDGARIFEEIDRFGIGYGGTGNLISSHADIDFYRILPPAGYTKGLAATDRNDIGEGDIPPEERGRDFFAYRPYHLPGASEPRLGLARIANAVQKVLSSGRYLGVIWNQASPRIEEAVYWLNLLIDTTLPICANAAQRMHGMVSNDGPKNIIDSVDYITSRAWADESQHNCAGVVLIQEQQIFAARDVQKGDARPGGYIATGGHGGIIGTVGHDGPPTLTYLPCARHTYKSELNLSRLPQRTTGVTLVDGQFVLRDVVIKNEAGELHDDAIPKVTIVKDGSYGADDYHPDPAREVDLIAQIEFNLMHAPLAGFVVEGLAPYGLMASESRHRLMLRAVHSGMPVVRVGRGNNEGFTPPKDRMLGGRNLTATKARLLLMACLMKFGSLPPAVNPHRPTEAELQAIRKRLAEYQAIFDTH